MIIPSPSADLAARPMPPLSRRSLLALVGLTTFAVAGCSTPGAAGPAEATRTVTHPLGTADVPVNPARVVALDRRGALPHLLALGITPVGALTHKSIIGTDFPALVAEQAADVTVLPVASGADEPALEPVTALHPDVIVGYTGGIEEVYPGLSQIAPTVAVDVDFTDAAVSLRAIAAAVGREAEAERVVQEFDHRCDEQLGRLGDLGSVSIVLGIGDQQFRAYSSTGSSVARWLSERGAAVVPAAEGAEASEDKTFMLISPERLDILTGDTIVVMHNSGPAGEAALAELEAAPTWQQLAAVRAGRVVKINSQSSVGSYGFQGYESVLDELTSGWPAG
ncbi:ABC transporter substrate-binding protein [Microlunatus speluncae]|uniref:ABC transporter substrate-binding protein n=1 Tax=Microlunatus speluncae TaxID=2594267 RepID=UPI0012664118|nr:ABC transporter substrate-binding protein [Microlunatus speluncae]